MFNALLGSFVAWSLTAGALPGPWPVAAALALGGALLLLHGHTHIPAWAVFGTDNLYLNPGSVSIPKAGTPHSYMTLENGVFTWKELGGEAYHTLTL